MKSIKNYKELAVSGPMMDARLIPILPISGGPEPLKKTNFVGLLRGIQGRDYPADSRAVLFVCLGKHPDVRSRQPQAHTQVWQAASEQLMGDSAKQRVVSLPKGTGRSNVRPN